MADTLADLIAAAPADAPVIGAPGRDWMTYGRLKSLLHGQRLELYKFGIGRGDRVAIVLPNGPEMAVAFFLIAHTATTAPLNPNYTEEEHLFYLKDLKAKAIVLPQDDRGPAYRAAKQLDLTILEMSPNDPAGVFSLWEDTPGGTCDQGLIEPDDIALILHTSGTTSRPKIVPLTHRNLVASALNIAESLALTPKDRCLNVMPLFHIHGLIAAVSATLASHGSIFCTPGFNALQFFGWMKETRPSWYTAVPTMHQAILSRAGRNRDVIRDVPLRFLRASSASLPPQVMTALGDTFGAPVIEGYGMTEATHQMASNPLPPHVQKPGFVGVEAGPEIRIASETEDILLADDAMGEVVISGANVTPGYESNPDANAKSFFMANGARWFRTGDQGMFDDDRYLRLTGRLKEIINRGGEKISPLEVDEVLLDHPAILQVVTFALPHPKLGEEVAAAVVLKEGVQADDRAIRDFAATRLAAFKVPRQVVILDEIPKGATGKMVRIGLADMLGLTDAS